MHKAFSLNELLVTIAIIGLLLVVGIPSFQRFSKSQVLVNASKDMQNAILETQSLSLAPKSTSAGNNLQSYMIVFSKSANSYNIYQIKDNVGTIVKEFKLPNNIQFDEFIGMIGENIAINFDITQRGLVSFYEQNEEATDDIITIGDKNFTQKTIAQGSDYQVPEIKIKYTDNVLDGKTSSVKIHPETAMMEIQ